MKPQRWLCMGAVALAGALTSCSSDTSDTSSPPSADEIACEQLAFVRDNWNIDQPRAGWPEDVIQAVAIASDSLSHQHAEALQTATALLESAVDPRSSMPDLIEQGDAQQAVNEFANRSCGFDVF